MPLSPDTRLGRYQVTAPLGAGGMGEVYRAYDTGLNRTVAIKVLSDSLKFDPQFRERFEREARAVAALEHPSICAVHDIGEHEGRPFIVMPLLEGQTLAMLIDGQPLDIDDTIEYGIQIADGLDRAHGLGIVHRDLKPANIFITSDRHAKILDFGLAKVGVRAKGLSVQMTITPGNLTSPGQALGTVAYMSPEQAHGLELDARSDLFSFGAILYEMATGRPAFPGATSATVFDGILNRSPTSPLRLNPHVPARLEDIIGKALEKSREVRYQSASEIRADLKRLRRDNEASHLTASVEAASGGRSRRAAWVVAAAVVVAIAAVVAAVRFLQIPDDRSAPRDMRMSQLLSSVEEVVDPVLSPDGKIVAYVTYDQGQRDLFVSRTAGGGRVRVTNDAAVEAHPRFSPDGETILFSRIRPDGEIPELCTTPAFGSDVTPLISGARDGAWSPDGSQIVFVRVQPGAPPALAIADASGQHLRTIMQADSTYIGIVDPSWSRDGTQVAVVRSMGGVSGEIWTVPVAGGNATRLWKEPPEVFSHRPVFTPDGGAVVHSSNRGGATNLWMMFLDGSPPVRITSGAGPDVSPSVARDGSIAFANPRHRYSLIDFDLVSGTSREVSKHSSFLWAPAFSPSRSDIAVSRSEPDGSWHVWLVSQEDGSTRRLTGGALPEIYPRFTPDGQWILYSSWSAQPDRVWKVARTGGAPLPVTPARGEDDAYADVSPDGTRVAFARTEGDTTRVYVMPLEGGEARRLTASPSTIPRWSPDGRSIAFSADRSPVSGISVISSDGVGERRLTATGSWPVWLPDGKRIAYLVVGPDGNQRVQVVAVDGGASTAMRAPQFVGWNFPIDLASERRLATTNAVHLTTEVWLATPVP